MKNTDLKKVIIPQVGVRYEATEFKNKLTLVKVYGSDSIGWKVWVETTKPNGNKTIVCVNPKNGKGEMLVYKTSDLATWCELIVNQKESGETPILEDPFAKIM